MKFNDFSMILKQIWISMIFQELWDSWMSKTRLKFPFLELHWDLPGANELIKQMVDILLPSTKTNESNSEICRAPVL